MSDALSLKPADWPPIDQQRWREARMTVGFLSERRPARNWSLKRCRIVEQGYGQWLAFLVRTSQLDPDLQPGDRVTVERFQAFVAELQDRVSPWSTAMMVQAVARMLTVMAPGHDWNWLKTVVANLKQNAQPSRDKRGHLVEARQLYALGLMLMDRAAEQDEEHRYHAATMARDGLLIAMLTCCPVRIANLAAIRIGMHLWFDGAGYHLRFGKEETKNGNAFEGDLPHELRPYIEHYLQEHRAYLLAQGERKASDHLWINRWGLPMQDSAIRVQIEKRSRDAFGRHVWPHLVRTIAATGFVDHAPEAVGMVSDLLGHTDTRTAHRYYVLSTGALAHKAVQSSLEARRAAAQERVMSKRKRET
ncbi:tyrosine-type recombinase/integrase [Labrys sp. (in: a-proteobacteria)]|uniref:tyrosine-type recombinase/integrase n=1 Tax=Labrys sp. (in: a-proteobacteria) TaxID=1917972 RepID=UPI0039E398B2